MAAQPAAVVFDLLYTLIHPSGPPDGDGGNRMRWLSGVLGVDTADLEREWAQFEPMLESGQAPSAPPLGPELTWLTQFAAECGRALSPEVLALIEKDWDGSRSRALLVVPEETLDTLSLLRQAGFKIGVLSNTHALEIRRWSDSPIAALVDAVALSHEIGVMKPAIAAYEAVLAGLNVAAASAIYVGDGSSGELEGARRAGFGMVCLAAEAPKRLWPQHLYALQKEADLVVNSISELTRLMGIV